MPTAIVDGLALAYDDLDARDPAPREPADAPRAPAAAPHDPAAAPLPLLLLHGFTGAAADFGAVLDLPALARTRRVLAPDARGHGRSAAAPAPFTHRRLADDVLALLDHAGVERAVAIGLSMGGNTLLHAAAIAPARFAALVVVSATCAFPPRARAAMRAMALIPADGDPRRDALAAVAAAWADDPDEMTLDEAHLARVAAPTLVVHGGKDPLYPDALAARLRRGLARAALWRVEGGGHLPIFGERAAAFAREALGFLDAPNV